MSRVSALARRLGHRRWFARVGRVLVPLDRILARLTGGRIVAMHMEGLPGLLITTTGRRSGEARTNPLLYASDGDNFVVIGSNWGQQQHPAWSANLLANPDAVVTLNGRQIPVRAHLARGAQRERLWALLLAIWPAYETYQERAPQREIRIFLLERR